MYPLSIPKGNLQIAHLDLQNSTIKSCFYRAFTEPFSGLLLNFQHTVRQVSRVLLPRYFATQVTSNHNHHVTLFEGISRSRKWRKDIDKNSMHSSKSKLLRSKRRSYIFLYLPFPRRSNLISVPKYLPTST